MLLALAIVALAQTGVLAGMVIDRVRLLKTGREITLPIVPVDPRDLFRGEYVRLGYEVGQRAGAPARRPAARATTPPSTSCWRRRRTAPGSRSRCPRAMPQETSPDRIVLKARRPAGWPRERQCRRHLRVRYGIESYFVPEGQGRRLENLAREKKLAALVAVDGRGNAAIKGLIIDGVLQYEEPLF